MKETKNFDSSALCFGVATCIASWPQVCVDPHVPTLLALERMKDVEGVRYAVLVLQQRASNACIRTHCAAYLKWILHQCWEDFLKSRQIVLNPVPCLAASHTRISHVLPIQRFDQYCAWQLYTEGWRLIYFSHMSYANDVLAAERLLSAQRQGAS